MGAAVEPCRPFYGEYAWAYDLLMTRPAGVVCDAVEKFFAARGVAHGARVLDAGCGTGRHAADLARRGYVVTGLDLSAPLLMQARRRIRDGALPLALVRGDILALPFARGFDALLCRGVLNDLRDEASRARAFAAFAGALRPGGAIILDVREWEATAGRKCREPVFETSVSTARGTLTFRSVTRTDPQTHELHVSEQHTLSTPEGQNVSGYEFVMRCWTREELHSQLTAAGFGAIEYFGGYDARVPAGATDRLVAVARAG